MKQRKVKILQYPRGVNKGGVISIDYCPTISTSSFQHNCFLIVYDSEKICVKDRAERLREGGKESLGAWRNPLNENGSETIHCKA